MNEIINELSMLICQCVETEYIASIAKRNLHICQGNNPLCRCETICCDVRKNSIKNENELNELKRQIADIVIDNALDIIIENGTYIDKFNIAKCQLNNGLNKGVVPDNVKKWYKRHHLELPF